MSIAESIRWKIRDLRRSATGEITTMVFHTAMAPSNAEVDREGNPINPDEAETYSTTPVEIQFARVIEKGGNVVEAPGGEYSERDLIIEVDIEHEATVDATKEGRGYVAWDGENYRINKVQKLGMVTDNRIRLWLQKWEM